MPDDLHQFLREWLEWATSGAPKHPAFHRSAGLCLCYFRWTKNNDNFAFCNWFIERWGGHPFTDGARFENDTHLNPKRLQWVKDQLYPRPERFDEFLVDWLEWTEAGAPKHKYFDNDGFGLCYNYQEWARARKLEAPGRCYNYMSLNRFDESYPFKTMDERIAWVRKELANAL